MRGFVYAACFASGVAGLTYEVIWLRLLAVQLGNAAFASSAVLAAVMGGMGTGAVLIGRWADRRDPLAVYGALEIALGVMALTVPAASEAVGEAVVPLLRATGPGPLGVAARLLVASLVLFVPSCAMGATVPVLVRFASRASDVGASTGVIYALNTGGAALGAGLAGFYLLGRWGIRATGGAAAVLDVGVGLAALGLAAVLRRRTPTRPAEASPELAPPLPPRLALLAAGTAGLSLLALEGLWIRFLTIAAGHDVYAFTAMLVAVLLGLALGAALYRALPARLRARPSLPTILLAAIGVLALLTLGLVGRGYLERGVDVLELGRRLSITRSHELSVVLHATFAALLVLAPAVASGALLPALVAAYRAERGTAERVGRVLAANTVGSIAGAFVGPLILVPALGLANAFALVASLPVAVACALGLRRRRALVPSLAAALLALAAAVSPPHLPQRMLHEKIGPAHLRFDLYAEGPTATVAVVDNLVHPERTLYLNGINEVTTRHVHDESFSLLGHLPLLLHPRPRSALVICLGGGLSAGAVARHPDVERITVVDLARTVAQAPPRFAELNHDVLDDPRVELVFDDGRNHLRTTDRRYDVMVIDSTHPRAVDSWILYTREMYETARARLAEGGWLAQWVPLHGLSVDEWRILTATFLAVFPEGSLFLNAGFEPYGQSGYALLVAQRGEGRIDPDVVRARLEAPPVREDLGRWGLASVEEVLECFVAGPERLHAWTDGAPVNTDDLPITQFVSAHSAAAPMEVARFLEVLTPIGDRLTAPAPHLEDELDDRREARALLYAGHLDRAAEVCGRGCAKYPLYRRQLARGPAYYRGLARRYPDDADRLLEIGASLAELGHMAEGRRHVERAAEVAPDRPRVWLSVGIARAVQDDDAAVAAFERALDLEPDLVLAHVALGLAEARRGNRGEATVHLSRAVQLAPEIAEAHAALGHALGLDPNAAERAAEHLRRALALDPRQRGASLDLARQRLGAGDARGAARILAEARRYHPLDPDVTFTHAVALARIGDRAAAREALDRVLLVAPADEEARAARRELGP